MKRFYKAASTAPGDNGQAILFDGRPVRTPARALLTVPGAALAEAIAAEWNGQGDEIDPGAMPMTGLANATIDRVLPALGEFRGQVAAYGASDLFYYRADHPDALVTLQKAHWDAMLNWAAARYGVEFILTSGIMPADQQARTLAALRGAVEATDPWLLAGMMKLVSIGGSLVGTLAYLEDAASAEDLWTAVSLDERFQLDQWGSDPEAETRLTASRAEFMDAAHYCALVRQDTES